MVLSVENVDGFYGSVHILHDINLEVRRNECVAVVGESGSGKTTLARCISGLHSQYKGDVKLGDARLAESARRRTAEARKQIQYVFQNPYASLNPRRTVGQTIARQLQLFGASRRETGRRVAECLERVSLSAAAANRYPDQLSGGERQRVAIARALAAEPSLLVCDEVTSALDVSVQAAIVELLRDLRTETGLSMLFITHNLALIRTIADRVLVMTEGEIVESGATVSVFELAQRRVHRQAAGQHPHRRGGAGTVNTEAFITCAVTGAGDTTARSDHVPVTPDEIAASALQAVRAGAAVVHIHVRDPSTGQGSRDVGLYRRVVEIIRGADVDAVINLTAGMGGDLMLGGPESPLPLRPDGTDLAGAVERLAHVEALMPEICTLDCGTMNFAAGGDYVMANTPEMLRAMARRIQELGVRPELEVFDTGQLVMVKDLIDEGLIDDPVLIQLCMGIRYGAPDDPGTLLTLVNSLPAGAVFSAFSIGRMQLPYVAMAVLAGGNVRVGLEDNLYLGPGQKATNGELVERATTILNAMNVRVLGPEEVRERLALRPRG